MYAMHHVRNNRWTSSGGNSPGSASITVPVMTEQVQVTKTKSIIFGKIPIIRGCLLLDALAWPQQLQVESKTQI
jgi:hypothetical protein